MRERLDTVLLLSLDCVRRESLGCFDVRHETDAVPPPRTPNVDWIAQGGVRFDQAITQAPYTPAAHASIFTGLEPYHHGIRAMVGRRLAAEAVPLAQILSERGFATAAFPGAHAISREYGLDRGFEVFDEDFADARANWVLGARRDCRESTRRAVRWLGAQDSPLLLFVHYFDCHDVAGRPETATPAHQVEQMNRIDERVGDLLRALDETGRLARTLFVVLSDHGDAFGEHGEHCHREYLYDTTLRIPLVLRGGRFSGGRAIAEQVRAIDVLPTILEELGIEGGGAVDGISLGGMLDDPRDRPAYSETCHEVSVEDWNRLRLSFASLRKDGWKFILDRLGGGRELYFLAADPGERTNLASIQGDLCDRLEGEIASLTGGGPGGRETGDGMTAGEREAIAGHLRDLGYLEA